MVIVATELGEVGLHEGLARGFGLTFPRRLRVEVGVDHFREAGDQLDLVVGLRVVDRNLQPGCLEQLIQRIVRVADIAVFPALANQPDEAPVQVLETTGLVVSVDLFDQKLNARDAE